MKMIGLMQQLNEDTAPCSVKFSKITHFDIEIYHDLIFVLAVSDYTTPWAQLI